MKKLLVDFEAFLMGLIPALYGTTASPNYTADFHLLERYRCVTKGINQHTDAEFFSLFSIGTDERRLSKKAC
ncbi:hypothetical protein [Laceyella sacchari]|uniref:hypothetical protein n=1 Tax=Laceyella sacchari TaxID=37482 RepID=UPI0010519CB6|nr:hypothetical protein [Laceyella sacchari]